MNNKRITSNEAEKINMWTSRRMGFIFLLCLWLVAVCTNTVIISSSYLLGMELDLLDYLLTGFVLLIVAPFVYVIARRREMEPVYFILMLILLYAAAELMEEGFEHITPFADKHKGALYGISGLLLIMLPLLVFALIDMRHRKKIESKLFYLAYHDMLTGLPNRKMFEKHIESTIVRHKQNNQLLAVLFIDLVRFKNINNTFGHVFGDLLLIEAADRLRSSLRSVDQISRPGGDEFCVLIEELTNVEDAHKIAQKLLTQLTLPFKLQGHELRIGCSIGIALYPDDGGDPVTLMKNADTAMCRVKELGKTGFQRYTAEMNDTVIQTLIMEEWLNKAFEEEQFALFYQPQINIDNNRIIGMEALLRWKHPNLGLIPPSDFIPLAEETGLIIQIGEWVLRTACKQNVAWQQAGYEPMRMAVNISPIQFHQTSFVDVVLEALENSGLDPQYLELEITEGIAMFQVDQVIHKLQTLRSHGVQISIDDFGTGYSSLTYLKKFPIHKLKIAQEFVRDLTFDPDNAAIVQAIIAMAHSLKLDVIAEGVETHEQLEFLTSVQCREIQGYIYSRPLPAHELTQMMPTISTPSLV
ncbi:diguanylate cyclase (GGDEF) domain-containing protein [Paenibacillus sp. 1_12]|uniref:putative bifunctional diguanylate cyclase/phosphodiesterase n=1 Tax=Paenibacillus sp. 1_12 TaxID=1566278 RepID=UPI0008E9CEED|nr:EAL domain-containing protein [Paenibacillus sp. 1_12]SFL12700.1 diguanylate cyclase (GGDEF) domain-containing protein [Paenibacillus sp. 1_12]